MLVIEGAHNIPCLLLHKTLLANWWKHNIDQLGPRTSARIAVDSAVNCGWVGRHYALL